jgi:hypothetical protein
MLKHNSVQFECFDPNKVTCNLNLALNVSAVQSPQTRQCHTETDTRFLKKQVSSFRSPLSKFEICLLPPNRTSLMTAISKTTQCYWPIKLFICTNEMFPKAGSLSRCSISHRDISLQINKQKQQTKLRERVEYSLSEMPNPLPPYFMTLYRLQ